MAKLLTVSACLGRRAGLEWRAAHAPIAYIVPMHRVVGANGLGGFGSSGREKKRQMLKQEGVHYAPVKIQAAKAYGQRMSQEDVYRQFLDIYRVNRRG